LAADWGEVDDASLAPAGDLGFSETFSSSAGPSN
jgi:hypothetical protein